jgi:serine O-acetyltransferase
MRKKLKAAAEILSSIRLIPLIAVMLLSSSRTTVFADLDKWALNYRFAQPRNLLDRILLFVHFMTWMREFRNVFYFRTGLPGALLSILCRPLASLYLDIDTKIGPGLFIQHGDCTHVAALEIGENCWINQQVAIGFMNDERPSIGNNVMIYAGAKILGNVKVGDNATIGANSVVIMDVPANATVMGIPATVRWSKQADRSPTQA